MINKRLLKKILPWLEKELGTSPDNWGNSSAKVTVNKNKSSKSRHLWAIRSQNRAIVTIPEGWLETLSPIINSLTLDELFSIFGSYELSRATLPMGTGVFGPSWYLFADGNCFQPNSDPRTIQLKKHELSELLDPLVFWHCSLKDAVISHAVFEGKNLVAVATTRLLGEKVFEIGVDVTPQAKSQGLGTAVVSAAGEWILEQEGIILAVSAPWNIPSVRTMRSLGLQLILTEMASLPAPFRLPPQALGLPYPGAPIYNFYPAWSMNSEIHPSHEAEFHNLD